MLLLRRGRSAHVVRPSIEVDVVFDMTRAAVRTQGGCRLPWRPPTEVFEIGDTLVVRAELGGLADGDFEIVVDREDLTIRGERSLMHKGDVRRYHESRIEYGPFDVSLKLPFPVDVRAASAVYEDGMLTIRLPRLAATRIAPRDSAAAEGSERGER